MKIANQEFDLVILDHVMPGKPGIEFIEHLRSSVRYNKLKIVLISGYLQEEDVLTAIKNGIKHIIVKPFSRQQLINHVQEILKLNPEEKYE